MSTRLSVVMIAKNAADLLADCLASVSWADEVVVLDSGSTDNTVELARSLGAQVYSNTDWQGYGIQRQRAQDYATHDWVLMIDTDERVTPELKESILKVLDAPQRGVIYSIARRNYFLGRFMRHSGWYPDRLLRVFRRNGVHFTQSGAHEHIDPNGRTRELGGDILHYPYKHFREHLDKINSYAQQGADDLAARGKKGGLALGVLHGIGRFLRIYLLKKGFLDGKAGFINAVHGAFYAFLKYVRVDEGNWGFPYNHR